MITIWKYVLKDKPVQKIELPEDYQIVSTQMVGTDICLWIMIDTKSPKKKITIEMIETGEKIDMKYKRKKIDTVQKNWRMPCKVYHLFQRLGADVEVKGKKTKKKDMTFPYGKYIDEPIWAIAEKDPSYLNWWVLNVKDEPEFTSAVKSYLESNEIPAGFFD